MSPGSGASPRRVLLALAELDYPTPTLRRVAALATALSCELHIVRVLAPAPSSRASARRSHPGEVDGERVRLALRGTVAWWARTLLEPPHEAQVQLRVGAFALEVAAQARALCPACVLLAPVQSGRGGAMMELMRRCPQPVFSTPADSRQWAEILAAAKSAGER